MPVNPSTPKPSGNSVKSVLDPTLPFASGGVSKDALEVDYKDMFDAYKTTPTTETRGALLQRVDPVINTAIKSYGGPSAGSPMLRSQARQMAIKAFDTYDPQRGTLQTHLLSQLRGLQRHGHQQNQIIRMPEQVGLDRMHLDASITDLTYSLGREPTATQLADHTGLSMKRIAYIRQGRAAVATGSMMDEDGAEAAPVSQIPGVDHAAKGWSELVYYDLSDTNQLVFDHMLGRHGKTKLKPAQLAAKLGISQSAISQRTSKIQKMLDEQHETELF